MRTIRKKIVKDYSLIQQSPFTEVHVGSRTHIQPSDIVLVSADISYSYIHLSDGSRIIVSTNIQKLEERFLAFQNMVRVHRSYMINTDYFLNIQGNKVLLTNDIECTVSRRKRENLLDLVCVN
jgi:two-component system, LytTR family, response regulator